MKTAKERLERFRLDTGIDLRHGIVCRLIEEHEADVVEAIATWISADEEAFGHAFGREDPRSYLTLSAAKEFAAAIRSGAWRKAGK